MADTPTQLAVKLRLIETVSASDASAFGRSLHTIGWILTEAAEALDTQAAELGQLRSDNDSLRFELVGARYIDRKNNELLIGQRDAARALAGRLWCDDRPEPTIAAIEQWLLAIPRAEADALNAEVGVYEDISDAARAALGDPQ